MSDPAALPAKPTVKLPWHEELQANVVIVGANGSGKSRLGAWIEDKNKPSHRISAQRALKFADRIRLLPLKSAENLLFYGEDRNASILVRGGHRWKNNPTNHVLDDFDALLATLFARQRKRDSDHIESLREIARDDPNGHIPKRCVKPPPSETDRIVALWRVLFPHRRLMIGADSVRAHGKDVPPYEGRDMSDGERVAFYLAGQVLCAKTGGILIFDEPEIHLHRAVLGPLWDALEELRPDCLFLYLTHDVQFAATRTNCAKIWLRSWDGKLNWDWQLIEPASGMPEDLLLSVLGSRRPCLFVEGEPGSLDFELLSLAYPDHYVVPRGSCEKVIETTKAYREYREAHHVEAEGIIDRDHRSDEEVRTYRGRGVRVLPVAEIENLLLSPAVVRFVAAHQELDPEATLLAVQDVVVTALQRELDTQIKDRAMARARLALSGFVDAGRGGQQEFVDALGQFTRSVEPSVIWREADEAFNEALRARDYEAILRLYNRKNLVRQVARRLELTDDGYVNLCRRLARADDDTGRQLRAILRAEIEKEP